MQTQFFRASVGAVIFNNKGEVLAFERNDVSGSWQFPQGGIELGEEPNAAIQREIAEETGIDLNQLEFIRECPYLLSYELPPESRNGKTGRGQTQRWFLFRYMPDDLLIQLPAGGEFRAYQWMPMEHLTKQVVHFRKELYQKLGIEFTEVNLQQNTYRKLEGTHR